MFYKEVEHLKLFIMKTAQKIENYKKLGFSNETIEMLMREDKRRNELILSQKIYPSFENEHFTKFDGIQIR